VDLGAAKGAKNWSESAERHTLNVREPKVSEKGKGFATYQGMKPCVPHFQVQVARRHKLPENSAGQGRGSPWAISSEPTSQAGTC
jgi:hypothetical protein